MRFNLYRIFFYIRYFAVLLVIAACTPDVQERPAFDPVGSREEGDFSGLEKYLEGNRLFEVDDLLVKCKLGNPIKVLIWGQSISERFRTDDLAVFLEQQWPTCDFQVKNLSRGGCSAACLNGEAPWDVPQSLNKTEAVKYFEKDVIPFDPDYVIFHVYGDHRSYANLMNEFRQRTSARIEMLTDHIVDEMNPNEWSDKMAKKYLPDIAKRNQFLLVDVRSIWSHYLYETGLTAKQLLEDDIHPNSKGIDVYMFAIQSTMKNRDLDSVDTPKKTFDVQ